MAAQSKRGRQMLLAVSALVIDVVQGRELRRESAGGHRAMLSTERPNLRGRLQYALGTAKLPYLAVAR
jgi:hypothetical protein